MWKEVMLPSAAAAYAPPPDAAVALAAAVDDAAAFAPPLALVAAAGAAAGCCLQMTPVLQPLSAAGQIVDLAAFWPSASPSWPFWQLLWQPHWQLHAHPALSAVLQ